MQSKGQALVVKEVLIFGLSLVLIIGGTFLIFNNYISPGVASYSEEEQAKLLVEQIDYVISSRCNSVLLGSQGVVSYRFSMPNELAGSDYRVRGNQSNIIIRVSESGSIYKKGPLLDGNYSGTYFSGGKINVMCKRENGSLTVSLTNLREIDLEKESAEVSKNVENSEISTY